MCDVGLLLISFVLVPIVIFVILFIGIEFGHGWGGPSNKSRYDPEQMYLEQKSFHNAVMDQMRYNSLPDTHGIEELGQSIGGMANEVGNLMDCFTD